MKRKIQKDLDAGMFGKICSNEDTFKNYIFPLIDQIKKDLLDIADAGEYEDLRWEVKKYFSQ